MFFKWDSCISQCDTVTSTGTDTEEYQKQMVCTAGRQGRVSGREDVLRKTQAGHQIWMHQFHKPSRVKINVWCWMLVSLRYDVHALDVYRLHHAKSLRLKGTCPRQNIRIHTWNKERALVYFSVELVSLGLRSNLFNCNINPFSWLAYLDKWKDQCFLFGCSTSNF